MMNESIRGEETLDLRMAATAVLLRSLIDDNGECECECGVVVGVGGHDILQQC